MAAINRAPWNALVDDDGSNLVGTPWTKDIVKTVLLDPIDAAIATLAPIGGAAMFSTVTASTGLAVGAGVATLTRPLSISVNQPAQVQQQLINTSADPAAYTEQLIKTDGTTLYFGTEGAASSDAYGRNRAYVLAGTTTTPNAGLDVFATAAGATIRFHTSGFNAAAERLRITDAGAQVFGTLSTTGIASFGSDVFALAGSMTIAGGGSYRFNTSSRISSPADGVVLVSNGAGNDLARLCIGGISGAYPSLGRLGAAAVFLLADASNYAQAKALDFLAARSFSIDVTPALSGAIRLPNAAAIMARNADNTSDYRLLRFNPSNQIEIGDGASDIVYNGYDVKAGAGYVSIGTNPANAGALRLKNATYIDARNGANTGDIALIGLHSDDVIYMGSSGCVGVCPYNPATPLGIGSAPWASIAVAGAITLNNTVTMTAAAGLLTISGDVTSTGANGFRAPSAGGFYWPAKTFIACDATGHLTLTGASGAVGVGLDFSTEAVLKIRNRGFSADAALSASKYGFSTTSAGLTFNGTNLQLLAADGGAYFYIGNGAVIVNSAYLTLASGGTPLFALQVPTATGQIAITNGSGTTGVGLDLTTDGVLKIKLRDQGNYGDVWCGALRLGVNPASAGAIRLPNSQYIYGRNNANTADIFLAGVGAGDDKVYLGHPPVPMDLRASVITCQQGVLAIGTNPATVGALRLANGGDIYARNQANTADLRLLAFNGANQLLIGNATTSTFVYGELIVDAAARLNLAGYMIASEIASGPGAPPAGAVIVYARNTGGKTELIAYFNGGGVVRLAIQP